MWTKIKLFFSNWKTSVPASLALVCESADLLGYIPAPYDTAAIHGCVILVALGVIAAKDADKSHAPVPADVPKVAG